MIIARWKVKIFLIFKAQCSWAHEHPISISPPLPNGSSWEMGITYAAILIDSPGKIHEKSLTIDLGLHTARLRLGVLSGCQQMKEGEVRGSEKWERSWTSFSAQVSPHRLTHPERCDPCPKGNCPSIFQKQSFYHLHNLITHRRPIKLNYNLILS